MKKTERNEKIIFCIEESDKKLFMKKASKEGATISSLLREWTKAYIHGTDSPIQLTSLREDIIRLAKKYGVKDGSK